MFGNGTIHGVTQLLFRQAKAHLRTACRSPFISSHLIGSEGCNSASELWNKFQFILVTLDLEQESGSIYSRPQR